MIVDDPINSIPPLGGGFETSAFSKAAIAFSHLEEVSSSCLADAKPAVRSIAKANISNMKGFFMSGFIVWRSDVDFAEIDSLC